MVVSDVVYGGTVRLFQQVLSQFGVAVSFVDTSDPAAVAQAIQPNTRLVFIETPANPTLKLTDIAAIAKVAHAAGIKLAVDNTFLTPVLQRPLELGADITLLSTTKYIEGHNSTVGGSIATRDEALAGATSPHPQDAGLHSVSARVVADAARTEDAAACGCNSIAPARRRLLNGCEQHPKVARVHYPGLASFPQFALAQQQQALPGGIIAFELTGGVDAGIQTDEHGQALPVGRKPGRCRNADHSSGLDDAWRRTAGDSRAHGHHRRAGTALGGLENPADIIADLESALAGSCGHLGREGG